MEKVCQESLLLGYGSLLPTADEIRCEANLCVDLNFFFVCFLLKLLWNLSMLLLNEI
jgi:hypothetical protein